MSPNRRIFLNIIATYGRSLYALVIGLFSARWVFLTLGESDYGLLGVVGGLTAFINYINSVFAVSVGRFFAYSIGREQIVNHENEGLEECRQWFNTAFVIHSSIPLMLMLIGYPIGEWAVRHFLEIPTDRVDIFVWIFRFSCLNCFISMVSVPFNAMYAAKQYIAELTIYSFVTTTLNFAFLFYMRCNPGDWLFRYGAWSCLLGIVPSIIIPLRAYVVFPECHFNMKYMKSKWHLKKLGAFSGWYSFGMFGNLCRYNTLPILINKYFGPALNAAYAISSNIAAHTESLSGALRGAFQPAITNALGAGERDKALSLMYQTCKFGTLLVLIFSIPLCLEIDEVLVLWLRNPPISTSGLAIGVMAVAFIQKLTTGHFIIINANGDIARYQLVIGICFIMTFPLAWILIAIGLGIYSVVYAAILTMLGGATIRLVFLKRYFGEGPVYWLRHICLPICILVGLAGLAGYSVKFFFPPSFARVVITTLIVEITLVPLSWVFVLDKSERKFVLEKLRGITRRG